MSSFLSCELLGEKVSSVQIISCQSVSSSRLICDWEINTDSVVIHSLIVKVQIQLISFSVLETMNSLCLKGIFILTVSVNVVFATSIESLCGQVSLCIIFQLIYRQNI